MSRLHDMNLDAALRNLAAACLLAAAHGPLQAQALSDPTRPPAILAPARGDGAGARQASPAAPQLQSVLIARHAGGRRIAVIDGQTVPLGGTYKGATLSRMTETEVELTRGGRRQVLKLFASAAPARAAPARR